MSQVQHIISLTCNFNEGGAARKTFITLRSYEQTRLDVEVDVVEAKGVDGGTIGG